MGRGFPDDVYGDDVVREYWYVDGPHGGHGTTEAGRALAELVRFLNHATGPGHQQSAMPYANVANSLIGFLHSAVAGMPQLLAQLALFLERQAGEPSLYDDRRRGPEKVDAGMTAISAAIELEEAARAAGTLANVLQRARNHTTHLGNDDPPPGHETGR